MNKVRCSLFFLIALFSASTVIGGEPEQKFPQERPLDVEHIKLDVTLDVKGKNLSGRASLDVTAIRPVDTFRLDAVDFDVRQVQVTDSGKEEWHTCRFDNDGKKLTIRLPKPLETGGQVRVLVDYSVTDPKSGLSFFAPSDDDPEAPYLVWSQGESITNRYWVPCFDHPNERQSTEIVCTVDKPFKVISNGRLLGERENPDGTRTFHWLQDQPHVAYLMTLVAGEFFTKTVEWRGKPVSFHVREKFKDKIDNSFANTTKMLDFFSDKIGVEYPWAKYDQVCCYQFGGGMENTSATTLTEATLHDDRAHLDGDSDGLVAHELAHQWWGDLLTCKDWAHLWLNEGFASYFEALWDEEHLGQEEFAYNMHGKARGALEGGKDKPIVYRRYDSPDEQFDSRAYPKGAWVVHMIRRRLGDELFWKCMHAYATRHAYQTVETSDLRKAIEDVTGEAFERFFHDWTERPGAPVVTAAYEWNEEDHQAEVRVMQSQKEEAFAFPLTVEFVGQEGEPPVRVTRKVTKKQHSFHFSLKTAPRAVRIDPDFAVLMELTLELPRNCWEAMLTDDPSPIARIRAAEYFGKSDSARDLRILCDRLLKESFWGVQRRIAELLGDSLEDEARDTLLQAVTLKEAKARAMVVRALGAYEDDEKVASVLRGIVEKGDPSYRTEAYAIEAYADVIGDKSVAQLKSLMTRDSDNEVIRRSVLSALGRHGDASVLELLMEWSAPAKPAPCRSAAVDAIAEVLTREEVEKPDRKKAVESIARCLKGKGWRRLQLAALTALEKVGPDAKPALKEIDRLARHGGPRVVSAAKRAAKSIREGKMDETTLADLRQRVTRLEEKNRELETRLYELDETEHSSDEESSE